MIRKILSVLATLLFFVVSGAFIIWAQEINKETYTNLYSTLRQQYIVVPSADILKATSLGFYNLQADIQWLRLIQHVGENVLTNAYQQNLPGFIETVNELDPKFTASYELGMLLVPEEESEVRIEIGLKAMDALCDSTLVSQVLAQDNLSDELFLKDMESVDICHGEYTIPTLLAYNYFDLQEKYEEAARYYFIAWHTAGSPDSMERLTALMLSHGKKRDIAITMWSMMAEQAENDTERTYALQKLQREAHMIEIEKARSAFIQKTGQVPSDLTELVKRGFLNSEFLNDPFSSEERTYTYVWNEKEERIEATVTR